MKKSIPAVLELSEYSVLIPKKGKVHLVGHSKNNKMHYSIALDTFLKYGKEIKGEEKMYK